MNEGMASSRRWRRWWSSNRGCLQRAGGDRGTTGERRLGEGVTVGTFLLRQPYLPSDSRAILARRRCAADAFRTLVAFLCPPLLFPPPHDFSRSSSFRVKCLFSRVEGVPASSPRAVLPHESVLSRDDRGGAPGAPTKPTPKKRKQPGENKRAGRVGKRSESARDGGDVVVVVVSSEKGSRGRSEIRRERRENPGRERERTRALFSRVPGSSMGGVKTLRLRQ
ncbi:hypothetical protein ALC62_10616 [Cyphomyrmex costatus]|uniref:Uncharacterized protein n=1 Tax=Cyphomyrmex costatus TaxID=456900 RepID=A0A195CF15_9HYME|nr:hypothetical protein ALC62_10616 [Cyphomyrmex costatus]